GSVPRQELLWCGPFPANRLMTAVFTSDVTKPTVDAFLLIDMRNDLIIQVEISPRLDSRDREPADFADRPISLLDHPALEAALDLLADPKPEMHHGGANRKGAAPEKKEFDGVLPGLNAADAADRDLDVVIRRNRRDHVERDRLYGRPAITTMTSLTTD